VRVRLEARDGETWAEPVFGKSNLIFTLARAEGVIEAPLNSNGISAGPAVRVITERRRSHHRTGFQLSLKTS
jgi:molybdopterin molybdotransferase